MDGRLSLRAHMPLRVVVVALLSAVLAAPGCDAAGDDTEPSTTTSESVPPANEVAVQVFFVDEDAFNEGRPPYAVPVDRAVDVDDPVQAALDALFEGPSDDERVAGLRLVASEATGADVRVEGETAHVTLMGGCASGGSTLTVANEIVPTMLQFTGIRAVKIYDPDGSTQVPDQPGDSVPECLEP